MAVKWFYVCAGVFLLAAAYALGAGSAGAQAGLGIVAVTPMYQGNCSGYLALDASGAIFSRCGGVWQQRGTVPGPGPFAAAWSKDYDLIVAAQGGDLYHAYMSPSPTWDFTPLGNAYGGATPSRSESLGRIKARYSR